MSLEFTVPGINPQSPTYVAVDTNVLLDRAESDEDILDCLATIRERVENHCFAVLPTVIQELQDLSELSGPGIGGSDWKRKRDLAGTALDNILNWRFQPINFVPVRHGIVEQAARKIRERGIIPMDQITDSLIVAEAAALPSALLISSDAHICGLDKEALNFELAAAHLARISVYSPRELVRMFFRKR